MSQEVCSCIVYSVHLCSHVLQVEIGLFQKPSVQYLEPIDQLQDTYISIFDECPYNIHYKATHGHRQASCGPDAAELNAHQSAFLALATQDRRHTSAVGHVGPVPCGLSPPLHVQVGCAKASPLDEPPSRAG